MKHDLMAGVGLYLLGHVAIRREYVAGKFAVLRMDAVFAALITFVITGIYLKFPAEEVLFLVLLSFLMPVSVGTLFFPYLFAH